MDILNQLWNYKMQIFRKPKIELYELDYGIVDTLICDLSPNMNFISDVVYKAPQMKDIPNLFKNNVGRFLKYRAEEYDCDDFARTANATLHILYGNISVGVCAVYEKGKPNHMVNIVITNRGQIVYVEPQNNKIIKNPKFTPYFIMM